MVTSSIVAATRSQGSSASKAKPTLEIIPDLRFIVFHGGEHEAQAVKLSGRIRLTTPEPMSIMRPKVRLEGKRKIKWYVLGPIAATPLEHKCVFWSQEQKLGIETPHKVKAGVIEWPFEFELSPAMPESVEGLRDTYIAYHLSASISRPGWNAKDLIAHEHVRLVRTLGPYSMESTRSRVNSDVWANKVSYSISIPTDAIVFGTSITTDVELSPLKKGIKFGKIELRLLETVKKGIQVAEAPDLRFDRTTTEEREAAKLDMDFPEESLVTYADETEDNPTMADEMFRFQATLPLPKSLNQCRQDVESHSLNITHRFKLMLNIHNPEGHISQLVCKLPVKIFISPNLPVDETNEVQPGTNPMSDNELNAEVSLVAPPEYGQHQLDQMYSDIDRSGFLSRAGSTSATPMGIFAQSRRGSRDNVLNLNGLASDDGIHHHGSAVPQLLLSRLTDLQDVNLSGHAQFQRSSLSQNLSGGNSPATRDQSPSAAIGSSLPRNLSSTSYFTASTAATAAAAASHSASHTGTPSSGRTSGRTSDEDHTSGIQQHDYNMGDLSRVPSYNAATTRSTGSMTPFNEGPPSYVEATSRPPSPGIAAAAASAGAVASLSSLPSLPSSSAAPAPASSLAQQPQSSASALLASRSGPIHARTPVAAPAAVAAAAVAATTALHDKNSNTGSDDLTSSSLPSFSPSRNGSTNTTISSSDPSSSSLTPPPLPATTGGGGGGGGGGTQLLAHRPPLPNPHLSSQHQQRPRQPSQSSPQSQREEESRLRMLRASS